MDIKIDRDQFRRQVEQFVKESATKTKDEKIQSLKDAGILDTKGNLRPEFKRLREMISILG